MSDRKKVLILGGSSYIGRHLFAKLGPEQAIATYYRKSIDNGVYFDSLSMSLSDIIETPEMISHAVILFGEVNPDSCAADIRKSHTLNVESVKSVINHLNDWQIKPVFISSEYVFDGVKGNYTELCLANPILTYGRQKVTIERYLQDFCNNFTIIRLAKVFGSRADSSFFTSWLDAIERSQTIYCAYDQIFSPIYIEDAVESIIRLIEMDCNGIFHMSSHKPISRLELLEMFLASLREYSPVRVKVVPCSLHDFDVLEKRPLNVSMKPDKLIKTTGLQITDIEEVCKKIAKNVCQQISSHYSKL